jgi:hypothetical protein
MSGRRTVSPATPEKGIFAAAVVASMWLGGTTHVALAGREMRR